MKILATTLFLVSFFCLPSIPTWASDVNSTWTTLGQAKAEKKKRNGTLPFRPELSLEENNALIDAYRSRSAAVIASLPAKNRENWNLINRPVRFRSGDHQWQGRITAVMISSDEMVTVLAQLEDVENLKRLELGDEISGDLSIGE